MITSDMCIKEFKHAFGIRLTSGSIHQYEVAVRQMLSFCEKPFHEITTRDIRAWLNHTHNNLYKTNTVRIKLSGVKIFYRYCMEEGHITRNPAETIPLPKEKDSIPYYLERDQLIQLRDIVAGKVEERAVVEVLFATGVRVSELASITLEDINWSERMITIKEGKGKKGRIVLFTRECEEYLKTYLNERNDNLPYLFTNTTKNGPICIGTIRYRFANYKVQLGFHLSPHTLRHTFAAHLAKKGMKLDYIQALLGHEKQNQTKVYARLYNYAQKEMYDEWM